jgi:hypothetical protein
MMGDFDTFFLKRAEKNTLSRFLSPIMSRSYDILLFFVDNKTLNQLILLVFLFRKRKKRFYAADIRN